MGDNSTIEWTDATWNPVRGCSIVSKGCTNCYAMRQAHRSSGAGGAYEGLTRLTKGGPVWTGAIRTVPELLDWPIRKAKPHLIFVNSMSDLFYGDENDRRRCEKHGVPFRPVPFEFIADVFAAMACTTRHKYQVLTKRPQRMLEWFNWLDLDNFAFPGQVDPTKVWPQWRPQRGAQGGYDNCGPLWPLENVWLGVSVEDQAAADERIPLLLQAPAAVRWISAEPLLGPIDLWSVKHGAGFYVNVLTAQDTPGVIRQPRIDWIVAGGESGPGARPMHPTWARKLRDDCARNSVPFFFKQWGSWAPVGPLYADEDSDEHLAALDTDPDEWDREIWITAQGAEWAPSDGQAPPSTWALRRVGKKVAGRQLDGRTHDEYPA